MMNRLATEKSPYLLQHATNPVEWYPWEEEAFKRAKSEDKPIFLSIGYSTCHWCHVMSRESFEDNEVARLMNETFINIKVDREERPDIDNTYMTVCQMVTGQGGWPLTLILTPEKLPFYAATYLPKHSFGGRMGMLDFIPAISRAWNNDRNKVEEAAQSLASGFTKTLDLGRGITDLNEGIIDQAFRDLANRFDPRNGGFGPAPKFPSPHNILFLLTHFRTTGSALSLQMARLTLTRMRQGGIWDHVGYGFHRYSTDQDWLLPHFEKMLHDQAMLLMAYTEAWKVTENPLFRQTAYEITEYVQRRLASPGGDFYSAEDAESEGEEGTFYLWSCDEIRKILSPEDAAYFLKTFNFDEEGNFRDESTGRKTGRNIPHLKGPPAEAGPGETPLTYDSGRVDEILQKLQGVRNLREHPFLDDKVLTDWNGLMITALARTAATFGDRNLLQAAEQAWARILDSIPEDRTLHHMLRGDQPAVPALADDYAFLIFGLIELYQATLNPVYLQEAVKLQQQFDLDFYDDTHGGYFFTSGSSEKLLGRQKEIYDGALPSSNSAAIWNNYYLGAITGNTGYTSRAIEICRAFSEQITDAPTGYTWAVNGYQLLRADRAEIVITAETETPESRRLTELCRNHMPAGSVILLLTSQNRHLLNTLAPFTRNFELSDIPRVYICRNYSCRSPVTEPEEIIQILGKPHSANSD